MATSREPRLDEIVWSQPFPQGIHSNSVLWYFADSPFFDRTSNNAVLISQGMSNLAMREFLFTREAFEARLRSMAGLEFVVAQAPADPVSGTGVWVIRKQTRRKRLGEEDDITVHAAYFVVGEHIYMAPTLGDIFSSRIATISGAIGKLLPAADSVSKWTPSHGRVYQLPPASTPAAAAAAGRSAAVAKSPLPASKEATPLPDGLAKAHAGGTKSATPDSRLVEESVAIHQRYGGDYMDENPITGKPGEFHLSSTGRKDNATGGNGAAKLGVPGAYRDGNGAARRPAPAAAAGKDSTESARNGTNKSPKPAAAAVPKPKRKKSKAGPASAS